MKIKKRTIKRLRTAASKLFPDDDRYHDWLFQEYGYESTLELSEDEAREAIRKIDQEKKKRKKRKFGKRKGNWLSFEQKEFIKGLFEELEIPRGKRQIGFIKKQIGQAKAVDWLSPKEASKVITGLKRFRDSYHNGYESNRGN